MVILSRANLGTSECSQNVILSNSGEYITFIILPDGPETICVFEVLQMHLLYSIHYKNDSWMHAIH